MEPNKNKTEGERIAKVIARAGICSRRNAETLIAEGKVKINGTLCTTPATKVTSADKVMVNNKLLQTKEQTRLWLFHKPKACITTNKDPQGRTTLFDLLPKTLPRVISVGRLDYNSEGLILLTNDGELAHYLESPKTGWKRHYRVRAFGKDFNEQKLTTLEKGVTIEGMRYAPAKASIESKKGDNYWITITITEGKNREVRKLMEHVGLNVNRLIRTSFGPFHLGKLPIKGIREVPKHTLKNLTGKTFES